MVLFCFMPESGCEKKDGLDAVKLNVPPNASAKNLVLRKVQE